MELILTSVSEDLAGAWRRCRRANVCARQVAQAIEDVLLDRHSMPRTWAEASDRHQDLTGERRRRLQSEVD